MAQNLIAFRVSPPLREALERQAEAAERSLSQQIRFILQRNVSKSTKEPK